MFLFSNMNSVLGLGEKVSGEKEPEKKSQPSNYWLLLVAGFLFFSGFLFHAFFYSQPILDIEKYSEFTNYGLTGADLNRLFADLNSIRFDLNVVTANQGAIFSQFVFEDCLQFLDVNGFVEVLPVRSAVGSEFDLDLGNGLVQRGDVLLGQIFCPRGE